MQLTDRCRFLNCSVRMGGRVRDSLWIYKVVLAGGGGERCVYFQLKVGFSARKAGILVRKPSFSWKGTISESILSFRIWPQKGFLLQKNPNRMYWSWKGTFTAVKPAVRAEKPTFRLKTPVKTRLSGLKNGLFGPRIQLFSWKGTLHLLWGFGLGVGTHPCTMHIV